MTALTETRHAGEFILSEANGHRSRESGTVASGQTLDAGELVMLSGGNIVTWDGATASDCIGINIYPIDASSAAKPGSYIARDAEVNVNLLTYPASTLTLARSELLQLGIVCR